MKGTMLLLAFLAAGMSAARAEGTHVLVRPQFGCVSVEQREAILDKLRMGERNAANRLAKAAAREGKCRQFLRGDEVMLVSRRASDALCVRVYGGSKSCFWVHEGAVWEKY